MRQQLLQLPEEPWALRVIHGQLWQCMGPGGIDIFDDDLQQQRIIDAKELGVVTDAAALPNGDIVIASDTGLHHCSSHGI